MTVINERDYRPIPFYFINTTDEKQLTQAEIDHAMDRISSLHFGGIVLFNKPPEGFTEDEYLTDRWFAMTERFVLACRSRHLALWLNDGFNFPPGDAAGRIQQVAPHLCQKILVLRDDGTVGIDKLEWGFPAFEEPESSRLFIHFVYEEYKKRLGKYFGNGIVGFFSDADNRRMLPHHKKLLQGRPYFPWSSQFAEEFKKCYGYDIIPLLPRLLKQEAGDFARDYWQLSGRLYQQWFHNNYQWCHANGLKYTFHTSDTGPFTRKDCPRSSLYSEGEELELMEWSDYPGTDHELLRLDGGTHYDQRYYIPESPYGAEPAQKNEDFACTKWDLRAKYISSAAWLHGRKRALCEAFAATNWGVTFQDLRRIASWQIMQGINFFIPHAVHHHLCGFNKFFAPPEFSLSPLAYGTRQFNDFLAQWSCLTSEGDYEAPIGIIDPTRDIWQGEKDGSSIFEICDRLNRQGWGYRIIPREKAHEYKWIFDPANGIEPQLPPPPISFQGDGELHFMLRRLPDGHLRAFAANIWNDNPISGTIAFNGKNYVKKIMPGEIIQLEDYDVPCNKPADSSCGTAFEVEKIKLLDPHRIPLRDLTEWQQTEDLTGLQLLVPEKYAYNILCDGHLLNRNETTVKIYDDVYCVLPLQTAKGKHCLSFTENQKIPGHEPVYLSGNIICRIENAPVDSELFFRFYNMHMLSAKGAILTLSVPKRPLAPGLLRDQGYPFYSGRVQYDLIASAPATAMYFSTAGNITEIYIDGKLYHTVIFDGTKVTLPSGWNGKCTLIQYNTMGNQWEAAAYNNGLKALPVLLK